MKSLTEQLRDVQTQSWAGVEELHDAHEIMLRHAFRGLGFRLGAQIVFGVINATEEAMALMSQDPMAYQKLNRRRGSRMANRGKKGTS